MVLTFRLVRKWILKGVSAIPKTIGEKRRTRGTEMLIDQSAQNRADEILSAEMSRRSSAKAYISFCEASLSDATEIEKNGDIRWFFVEKLIYQYSRELLAGRISEQEAMDKIGLISISELQKFGANPASSLGEGVVLFLQEDQELAQTAFLDSSTFQFQSRRFHISRGASSYRSDSWLLRLSRDTHGSYIFRPKIDGLKKPQYIPEMIHFTSADSTYFHKFGPRFVLESISKGGFPHIHLVDASAKDIRLAEQMNSQFNMAFSFEEAPFLGELKYPKGYLISPRYLMLPEIMEHYDRPVLVTDIDSKPNFKFSEILDVSVGKDAMMRISDGHKKKGGGYPWRRVAGGGNLFSNSPGGYKIAQWVSRYISSVVSYYCNRDSWLVDQNALSTSASLAESAGLRIGDLRINGAQVIIAAQHMPAGKKGFTL